MSFRINPPSKPIRYYTIIVDRGELETHPEDHVLVRLKKSQQQSALYPKPQRRTLERIVQDPITQEWSTIKTYPGEME